MNNDSNTDTDNDDDNDDDDDDDDNDNNNIIIIINHCKHKLNYLPCMLLQPLKRQPYKNDTALSITLDSTLNKHHPWIHAALVSQRIYWALLVFFQVYNMET